MSALPGSLEAAAPQGDFAAVLAQALAVLDNARVQSQATPANTAAPSPSTATGMGQAVVAEAKQFLGVPYVWGGESPSGFDCSGLVQYVYGKLGVSLPRTSEEQALQGVPVTSLAAAKPGDLVFFAGSDGTRTAPGHVGIYIGTGKMIDAPYTGTVVQIQTVSTAGPVVAIRRVLPTPPPSLPPLYAPDVSSQGLGVANATSSSTPTSSAPVAIPPTLAPLFLAAGAKYGISPVVLAAIARHESGFTPRAVSSAGAEGLMQIMPGTANALGVTAFTPAQAIDGAAKMLSGFLRQYKSLPLALAAYNAGPGAVNEFGGIPPYSQTQDYVSSIMATLRDEGVVT